MMEPAGEAVFPTVSVDIAYGAKVSDFSVDVDLVAQHLRARGMSDEQIGQLAIHFSPNQKEAPRRRSKKRPLDSNDETLGEFLRETSSIFMYKPQSEAAFFVKTEDQRIIKFDTDRQTSLELSRVLVHELEHFIQASDEIMRADVDAYNRWRFRLAKFNVGDMALRYVTAISVINASTQVASDALREGLTAFDETIQGGATMALGAAAVVAYLGAFRYIGHEFNEMSGRFSRESYLHRPTEVAARYAEADYPLHLVDVTTIPVECESYDNFIEHLDAVLTDEMIEDLQSALSQRKTDAT